MRNSTLILLRYAQRVRTRKLETVRGKADNHAVQALSKQRNLLSASLLGSTRIQQQLETASTADSSSAEFESLLSTSKNHSRENAYRLALGVTAFPFKDPSVNDSAQSLLGVRFDVPSSEGKYDKPYYILAQRVAESSNELRIHRHTIPAFIPIRRYEEMYLPQQDEGYGSGDATSSHCQRQDMHGLLKHVRADLVSWTMRRDAIKNLQKNLRLPSEATDSGIAEPVRDLSVGMFGVRSLAATAAEETQIKIEWTNGAVGRLRISDRGKIERAVIYDHAGRMKEVEMMLTWDTSSILELASRLEAVYVHFQEDDDEDTDDDEDKRSDRTTP